MTRERQRSGKRERGDVVSEAAGTPAPGSAAVHAAADGEAAPVVELAGAAARAGGAPLWSGVDLILRPGEFLAVLGPRVSQFGGSERAGVLDARWGQGCRLGPA